MKLRAFYVLVLFVTAAPPPAPPSASAADRFVLIIDGLCRAIDARRGFMAGPLMMLIWTRLRRTVRRFRTLATRAYAGTLPTRAYAGTLPSPARSRRRPSTPIVPTTPAIPANPRDEVPSGRIHSPRPRLPRRFGWLLRLVPEAVCSRSQLNHLLSDPEIADLLAAAPQIGRMLRPLCHMLGIRPPPFLRNLSRPPSREQAPGSQSGGTNTSPCASDPPGSQPPSSFRRKPEPSVAALSVGPNPANPPPPTVRPAFLLAPPKPKPA